MLKPSVTLSNQAISLKFDSPKSDATKTTGHDSGVSSVLRVYHELGQKC